MNQANHQSEAKLSEEAELIKIPTRQPVSRLANNSTKQRTNNEQPSNQPSNRPINQPACLPTNQQNEQTSQTASQPTNCGADQANYL